MGTCLSCCKATSPLPSTKKLENGSAHAAVSREEIFFDSRAWLDSDCESDFFSIRGDFTPSCGSSPDHQLGSLTKHAVEKPVDFDGFSDSQSEHSPRMKLGEFFHQKNQDDAINGKVGQQNGWKTKELAQ